jgi:hypothetical protein
MAEKRVFYSRIDEPLDPEFIAAMAAEADEAEDGSDAPPPRAFRFFRVPNVTTEFVRQTKATDEGSAGAERVSGQQPGGGRALRQRR